MGLDDTDTIDEMFSNENSGDEVAKIQNIIDAEGTSKRLQGLTLEMRQYFFSKMKSSLLNNAALCSKQSLNNLSADSVISKAATIEFDLLSRCKTEFEYKYSASRKIAEFERRTAENKLCEELKMLGNHIHSSLSNKVPEVSVENLVMAESIHSVDNTNDDNVPKMKDDHSLKFDDSTQKQSTPTIISNVLLSSKFDVTKIQQIHCKVDDRKNLEEFDDPNELNHTHGCEDNGSLSDIDYVDWNDNDLALFGRSCLELNVQNMDVDITMSSNGLSQNYKDFIKHSEESVTIGGEIIEKNKVLPRDGSCASLSEKRVMQESSVEPMRDSSEDMKRVTINILRPIMKAYYLTELIPNKICGKHIFRQIHWDILIKRIYDEREIKKYAIDTIKSKKYLFDKIVKTKKWNVQSWSHL